MQLQLTGINRARHWTGAVLLLLLTACAAPQTRELLADAPQDLPRQIELAAVPFVPQTRYHCGPAALSSVLQYRQLSVDADSLAPDLFIPDKQGSLQIEVTATARAYGQLAYPLRPSLRNLLRELAAGNPVLVMQNLGLSWYPRWHYAVAIGYDLDQAELMLRSGLEARHRLSLNTFEKTWARAQYWALVIVPPSQVPATAELTTYLQSALDLQTSKQADADWQALQTAVSHWPDAPLAAFSAGNAAYARGDSDAALGYFQHATALHPPLAAAWNNYGVLLGERGCRSAAAEAIHCALQLEPDTSSYQASLAELTTNKAPDMLCPQISCPP